MIPNATTSSISSANVRVCVLLLLSGAAAEDAFGVVDVCRRMRLVFHPDAWFPPVCTSSVNARTKPDNDEDDDKKTAC